ncbi:hypothetical protein Tco_0271477 [Tanacetum coccineum]
MPTQKCMKSGVIKHLGTIGIQQHNGLVEETNVAHLAKVRCFLIQSGKSKFFLAEDTTMSTYLVNRSPSSAIRFKIAIDMLRFFCWLASIKQGILEPVKVKCIFLGYHVGTVGNKLWRLDDVTSKVVLYKNMGFNKSGEYKKTFIGSGVGTGSVKVLQGVQFELESQEDHAFEVEPRIVGMKKTVWRLLLQFAAVEQIYAHESETLMHDRKAVTTAKAITGSIHYAEIWDIKGLMDEAKDNILVSLKSSLSGDYDAGKNDFDYAIGRSITVMGRSTTGYGLMIQGCYKIGYLTELTLDGPVSRDLGSLREETDEITDLYQILEEVLLTERGDGVACIKRHRRNPSSDDARDLVTASGHSRFNKDLESST